MRFKRNEGMHTAQDQIELRILQALAPGGESAPSVLGYAAYPGYRFKAPQGAAFAVAKVLRSMLDKGLILRRRRGYSISETGKTHLARDSGQPACSQTPITTGTGNQA